MEDQNISMRPQQDNIVEIDLIQLTIDFFRAAKKRWWIFVIFLALGFGISYGVNFFPYSPLYQCEATFTVSTGENTGFYYSANAADQMSKTFPYILDSNYFRSVLSEALGVDSINGTISAVTIENSNMVTMAVSSPSAEDARAILEAALAVYPEVSRFVLGDIELHLIDAIQTPVAPYNTPSLWRVLCLGGLVGFVIAALITLMTALLNNTVRTIEDMERISSLECLGALPEVTQKARKKSVTRRYISVLDPRTPHGFRESMRSLSVRLRAAMKKRKGNILLITSSTLGEGKSTVAVNLAEQLAQEGKRVLLIDLDLREQHDGQLLGMPGGVTVAEALRAPKIQDGDYIRFNKQLGIFFWGGTKKEVNPSGLVGDPRLGEILQWLKPQLDYIILDTPPCGLFQDAAILADFVDASLLVVQYDTVSRGSITEALSMLNAARSPVVGYVFNAYPKSANHYGYGRYGYGKYVYDSHEVSQPGPTDRSPVNIKIIQK